MGMNEKCASLKYLPAEAHDGGEAITLRYLGFALDRILARG